MKIDSTQARLNQNSQEMFRVIQQAQEQNQDMAQKMIRLSVEQKINQQKQTLTDNLVDLYF